MKHVYALADLYLRHGDVEQARDAYLASLDADDGLAVLLLPAAAIVDAAASRRRAARCDRCGARLSSKRRRCRRCGLAMQ
jgi:Zn-dependent protease with chaperone function